ncbi:MAG: signal peptidase [Rickettsiaceae bacterium]|jgi:signal peptidase I|nr:signal peptidase [Rickettsiaceae bacterium]
MDKNNLEKKPSAKVDLIYELKSILSIILIALVIRTFAFEPFYIPSTSMEDTLLEGDYIFTTKFSYGYSKHSFPFSPDLFKGRILEKAPSRGDVVIFWPAHSMEKRYVKRLIGLPGDKVQLIRGVVYINDKPMQRKLVDKVSDKKGNNFNKYLETLDNGISYHILQMADNSMGESEGEANNTQEFYVPEGHYFFLGDNRDCSGDSRWIGTIPFVNFIGKAQIIFFSTEHPLWLTNSTISEQIKQVGYWFGSIRFKRFFNSVNISNG